MNRKLNILIMFLISVSPLVAVELWSFFGIESLGAVYYTEIKSRAVNFVETNQIDYGGKTGL
ncbi:MAG: hypothetical protein ACYCY6_02255 [Minisyncoccota bacterium]